MSDISKTPQFPNAYKDILKEVASGRKVEFLNYQYEEAFVTYAEFKEQKNKSNKTEKINELDKTDINQLIHNYIFIPEIYEINDKIYLC